MSEEKKYTVDELRELVKEFIEFHPDTYTDEWYAPVRFMESGGAEKFLHYVETGTYDSDY